MEVDTTLGMVSIIPQYMQQCSLVRICLLEEELTRKLYTLYVCEPRMSSSVGRCSTNRTLYPNGGRSVRVTLTTVKLYMVGVWWLWIRIVEMIFVWAKL